MKVANWYLELAGQENPSIEQLNELLDSLDNYQDSSTWYDMQIQAGYWVPQFDY